MLSHFSTSGWKSNLNGKLDNQLTCLYCIFTLILTYFDSSFWIVPWVFIFSCHPLFCNSLARCQQGRKYPLLVAGFIATSHLYTLSYTTDVVKDVLGFCYCKHMLRKTFFCNHTGTPLTLSFTFVKILPQPNIQPICLFQSVWILLRITGPEITSL